MAGNKYRIEVETGRLDSGTGTFLKGTGKGQFTWVPNTRSGLWATHDVRDLALLRGPNHTVSMVVTNNNYQAQLFIQN